jgi:hypothetical protein
MGMRVLDGEACEMRKAVFCLFRFLTEEEMRFSVLEGFVKALFNDGRIGEGRAAVLMVVLAQRPEALDALDCREVAGFLMGQIGKADPALILMALPVVIARWEGIEAIDFRAILALREEAPAAAYHCIARGIEYGGDLVGVCLEERVFDWAPVEFVEKREYVRCLAAIVLGLPSVDIGSLVTSRHLELMTEVLEAVDPADAAFESVGMAMSKLVECGYLSEELMALLDEIHERMMGMVLDCSGGDLLTSPALEYCGPNQ